MAYTFKYGDRPLDGYTIQRAVGRGGFGEVYYAISDGGREVAIKYLRDNPQVELRGVANCINLKSPHLVAIFDVKKTYDGEYAIIMEYCSGPSLRDLMVAEPNGFPPQKAAFFLREIAKGLSYLHDRGIVHRDLKPGNIFYDDGYVKIGDYGLSKFISVSRHSAQTASVGTVHYMAPEVGSGDYSRGIDVYALGVMAYEMLRGRVPFEGSTMAEILMKHLTSEPQLQHVPHPFGNIIRKSLEKDPRQRYQTVNEMVDELLESESVQESLAGFSMQSLEGAVARGAVRDPSPMPSPNPAPRLGQPHAPLGTSPLPRRLAKRLEKLNHKVDRKIAKLGGRRAASAARVPPPVPLELIRATRQAIRSPHHRRRFALGVLLSIGMAIGLGIICGTNIREEAGIAAGLLVPALLGSVVLSMKAIPWFGAQVGPTWAQVMIRIGCSAPLLAVGSAPVLSSGDSRYGFAMWLGLLAVAVFANWSKTADDAYEGELKIGRAIWTAFGALVATAIASGITDVDPEEYMFVSAGVAGVVSLIVQASMWWSGTAAPAAAEGTTVAEGGRSPIEAEPARRQQANPPMGTPWPPYAQPIPAHAHPGAEWPGAGMPQKSGPQAPGTGPPGSMVGVAAPRTRWTITRAFWSIVTFVLMGGAIVNFILTLVLVDLEYDERTGTILGCIACTAAAVFAVHKTTPIKRQGFWRETVSPLLLAVTLFGMGGTITAVSRHWWEFGTEGRVLSIVGMVMSSLGTSFILSWPVRSRSRKPPAFFQPGSGNAGFPAAAATAPSEPPSGALADSEPGSFGGDSALHGVPVGGEDRRS